MTVKEVVRLLEDTGNTYVLLRGTRDPGTVVVAAPSLVGRVLCTGIDGLEGETESYILPDEIRKGHRPSGPGGTWNNFGGEERVWLAPEGGRFSLFFPEGEAQTMDTYTVPEPLNSTRFQTVEGSESRDSVTCMASISLTSVRGTVYEIRMIRRVRLLEGSPFSMGYGDRVRVVGFETSTTVFNAGDAAWTRETGAPAIWTLGQFKAGKRRIVVVPYRRGQTGSDQDAVSTENFRLLNPGGTQGLTAYFRVDQQCVLFRVNGGAQTKLEFPHKTATGRIGAVDLAHPVLTIVESRVYPELDYVAGYALPYSGDPYDGGASSSFVLSRESTIPPFFEMESCSPALFLQPGESYEHVSRTYHIRGPLGPLRSICHRHLGTDWGVLETFDTQENVSF